MRGRTANGSFRGKIDEPGAAAATRSGKLAWAVRCKNASAECTGHSRYPSKRNPSLGFDCERPAVLRAFVEDALDRVRGLLHGQLVGMRRFGGMPVAHLAEPGQESSPSLVEIDDRSRG